jgi:hypothetical protein
MRLVKKVGNSRDARFGPPVLTDGVQKLFCENSLRKIALSALQSHKQNHLESPGARATPA